MKVFCGVAAIALATLIASPAIARGPSKPVSCIYGGVAHNRVIDHDKLDALIGNQMQAKDNDDRMLLQLIGQQVSHCRSKYGWNDKRQAAAVTYMQARLLYDSQHEALTAHGITFEMIEPVVDSLAPDVKQTYLGGTVSGDMLGAVIAKLRAAGATIDDASANDRGFLLALDKAIVSTLTEAQAEQSFDQR